MGSRGRQTVLRLDTKCTIHKRKRGYTGLHQNSSFCSVKGPVKRVKRRAIEWEKIFVYHTPDQVSRIYKELSKFNSKKSKLHLEYGQKTFTKEELLRA